MFVRWMTKMKTTFTSVTHFCTLFSCLIEWHAVHHWTVEKQWLSMCTMLVFSSITWFSVWLSPLLVLLSSNVWTSWPPSCSLKSFTPFQLPWLNGHLPVVFASAAALDDSLSVETTAVCPRLVVLFLVVIIFRTMNFTNTPVLEMCMISSNAFY